jgi:endonuclease III
MPFIPRQQRIIKALRSEYGREPMTSLRHGTPLELLIATMLSAQCTDKRVNIVTASLFRDYAGAEDYARATQSELESRVRSTGFYRNKAKNIRAAASMIVRDFGGMVPDTMDGLLMLPGVARKTANIVLTGAYGKVEGIAVDTHVRRLSQRLGLADSDKPQMIERQLMKKFKRKDWPDINRLLVAHGRAICLARKPRCDKCALAKMCPKLGV